MSLDTFNTESRRQREISGKKDAFDRWMNEPLVRMSISAIPAGEQKDALHMLLQSAFDAGHSAGQGNMASEFLQAVIMGDRKRNAPP